uniref:F-box domain-containing protein n=1 Tax=Panagrolaimus davidi TaxID=227884 RepID=A0A914PC13_9BILA
MDMSIMNMSMSPPPPKKSRLSFKQHPFGLPEPILYYLKKNANPKLLLKLMQVSKYFCFKEFPYFVVKDLKYEKTKWIYCKPKYNFNYQILDLSNLKKPLWITNGINCYTENVSLVSSLLSKVIVCDILNLRLEDQIISLNEFKFLISSGNVKTFTFCYSHVEYESGKIVPIDEIMKLLPNVTGFRWLLDSSMMSKFTSETVQNLIKFINPSILKTFCLMNIQETFDFKLFATFMDKNFSVDYELDFDILISHEYSNILQKYVNKKIETSAKKYFLLKMCFPRQSEKSIKFLKNIYKFYNQKRNEMC